MTIGVKIGQDVLRTVRAAIDRHGTTSEALIPVLSEVNEALGYLPAEAMTEIGRLLKMPGSQVFSVASFYRMFSTRPRGKHVIQFCESAPCHVVGGRKTWQALREELDLEPGETSADGKWTLLATSCPGICGVGPVIVIDTDVYGNVGPDRVPEILARYD